MPVKEVTVFKDGYAFVLHEGKMPTDAAGNVLMDYLPTPVIGTFWPYSADKNVKLTMVTAGRRTVSVERTALTLRERGAMRCGVSSVNPSSDGVLERVLACPPMHGADLSGEVTTPEAYLVAALGPHRFTVAALDYGIKAMTPHRMAERGITTHVLPSTSSAADVRATGPDAAGRPASTRLFRRPGARSPPRRATPPGVRPPAA